MKGFIDNVWQSSEEKRSIRLDKLPPLKINRHYQRKYPIQRLVWLQQSTHKRKVIVLEEIKRPKNTELRLRYYIMGKKPNTMNRWTFGQFATLLPPSDFSEIIELAIDNGMILPPRTRS